MADLGNDPRKSYGDICFYSVPTKKITPSYYKYLPKVIDEKSLFPEHNADKLLTVFIDHFGYQKLKKKKYHFKLSEKFFMKLKNVPLICVFFIIIHLE